MDIVANLSGMQRNVKFNSTKQSSKNNLIVKGNTFKSNFKKTFDLSKKEISKKDFNKKDFSDKDFSKLDEKQVENKEISKVEDDQNSKSMPKEEKLSSKNDETKLKDTVESTEELEQDNQVFADKVSEFLNSDINLEQDDVLAEFIEQLSELISQFTTRPKEEVMEALSERFSELESIDALLGEEQAIKSFVLEQFIGEENPLFASEDDVKMIKELMEKVEKLLDSEEVLESETKPEEDVSALVSAEVRGEELSVTKDKVISENGEKGVVIEEKAVDEPKIKVLDMRQEKDMKGNDNPKNAFVQILGEKSLEASSETSEVTPTQKVNPADLIEQIVTKAKVILEDNKSTMIMKLNPEHLGKVAIKLVSENGSLKGTFTVENQSVKEMLESNMISLKQQLEDSGIKVDKIEVSLSSSNEDSNFKEQESNNQQFNKRNKNRNRFNVIDETDSLAIMDEEELLGDSLVNFSA